MRKKLIDRLEEALSAAKIQVIRDGWEDFVYTDNPKTGEIKKDPCEWLDIEIPDKKGNLLTVHFYFEKNSTILTAVEIFKSKKKKGYKEAQRISL